MLRTSDLLDFYYDELYPSLLQLEKERKSVLKRIVTAFVVLVSGAGSIEYFQYRNAGSFDLDLLVGAFAGGGLIAAWIARDYRKRFKREIFRRLVLRIDPSLTYRPDGAIDRTLFDLSALFPTDYDRYEGNDYIEGTIGKTPIRFSDLKVQKETRDSKGRRHTTTVFAGTFVVTEFHKHFHNEVKIYPDLAEKYLGVFGSWLQEMMTAHLVRLDSPAFEKEFKVYAQDPVEAHYLLTPNIMEKLVKLRRNANAPVYLSFRLDKLFVAIENGGEWFEPTIFRSLLRLEVFKSYVGNLELLLGIVEELNLNRRIWSKE